MTMNEEETRYFKLGKMIEHSLNTKCDCRLYDEDDRECADCVSDEICKILKEEKD